MSEEIKWEMPDLSTGDDVYVTLPEGAEYRARVGSVVQNNPTSEQDEVRANVGRWVVLYTINSPLDPEMDGIKGSAWADEVLLSGNAITVPDSDGGHYTVLVILDAQKAAQYVAARNAKINTDADLMTAEQEAQGAFGNDAEAAEYRRDYVRDQLYVVRHMRVVPNWSSLPNY